MKEMRFFFKGLNLHVHSNASQTTANAFLSPVKMFCDLFLREAHRRASLWKQKLKLDPQILLEETLE
jgi:hypothetical protein